MQFITLCVLMSIDEVDFLLPEQDEEDVEPAEVFKLNPSYSDEAEMDPNDGVLNAISPQKSADLTSDGFGLAISPDRSNNISPAFESGEPFMMRPSLRPSSLAAPLADPFASPAQEKKVAFNILGSVTKIIVQITLLKQGYR